MISAVLGIVGSILTIIIWFGSHKRRRESEKASILKKIKKLEQYNAEAITHNDTVAMSRIADELFDLRARYRFLNGQK